MLHFLFSIPRWNGAWVLWRGGFHSLRANEPFAKEYWERAATHSFGCLGLGIVMGYGNGARGRSQVIFPFAAFDYTGFSTSG